MWNQVLAVEQSRQTDHMHLILTGIWKLEPSEMQWNVYVWMYVCVCVCVRDTELILQTNLPLALVTKQNWSQEHKRKLLKALLGFTSPRFKLRHNDQNDGPLGFQWHKRASLSNSLSTQLLLQRFYGFNRSPVKGLDIKKCSVTSLEMQVFPTTENIPILLNESYTSHYTKHSIQHLSSKLSVV